MGVDVVINPTTEDVNARLRQEAPQGVDGALEMSGHPSSLGLAIEHTRPGGRLSLLGVFPSNVQPFDINTLIFKGIDVQAIVGRRIWQTWDQMGELLSSGKLNLAPVITHQMHFTEFQNAMELMKAGKAGKVVLRYD
jgi:threonine 3-dehydrogenase